MNLWRTETVSVLNCSTFRAGSEEQKEGEDEEKGSAKEKTRLTRRKETKREE